MQLFLSNVRGSLRWLVWRLAPALLAAAPAAFAAAPPWAFAEGPAGEAIFKSKCVSCHGAQGEGTKKHTERLEGTKSLAQLVDLIGETMPDNDPGSLSKDDAKAVAVYVYNAIYSPSARERNRPARIDLARLTVRQYRHTVADLVGSFRGWNPAWGNERGLKGEYFRGRNFRDDRRVVERVDPQVNFDFGTEPPVPDKFDGPDFSIRWSGSLLAAETGTYEFTVHTDHAARLWVNDDRHPLIDAWVKSGNDTEYRGSLVLLGGRMYPLRLEFSKGKQGVDDFEKTEEKAAIREGRNRTALEAAARSRGADPSPPALNRQFAGAVCPFDSFPSRRPQLRLEARNNRLEGMGRGDHGSSD